MERKHFAQIREYVLDILFPARCIACGKSGVFLCTECAQSIPAAERETQSGIHALFDYRNPTIKRAIWDLKYLGRRTLARNLGRTLYEHMLEEYVEIKQFSRFDRPLLVPIPISNKRRRKRGYNQSELLIKGVMSEDANKIFSPIFGALVKVKDTPPQMSLKDRRKRLANLHGCFHVTKPEKIIGRNIILIDDVTTTGATLAEAKRALRSAGAKKIIAFTLAH